MTEPIAVSGFRDCEAALRNVNLKQALYDAGKVVMQDALVVLHGAEHARRRAVEVRVFRRNFFRYYEKELFPATMEETLTPFLAAGGGNLVELGYRATANLTADFAGIDRPTKSVDETEQLIRIVKKLSEGATLVHSTRDKVEVEAEVRSTLKEFERDFLQPSIARREALLADKHAGHIDDAALPRDVLTVLLEAREEVALAPDQLLREIAFYMQAGAHSTANSVVHAFHEICLWASDDFARWQRLGDPVFIQRCVHESLRLHPASPVAWRTTTCPMRVQGLGEAEAGRRVVLDLFQANRDPLLYGDTADAFDPDRLVPYGTMPSGLTFGIGLHTCLGRELDGGVPVKPDSDPNTHQYGIVALLLIRLFEVGMRPAPGAPPTADPATIRPNWSCYPITFF